VQREFRRKGIMNSVRIARLDAICFEWVGPESSGLTQQERLDRQWLGMYEQMTQFQREHGHCHVLRKWEGNPRLAEWVQGQRGLKSQGKLRLERLAKLEALGFLRTSANIDSDERWEGASSSSATTSVSTATPRAEGL